jgi:RHS repeat-associated protein
MATFVLRADVACFDHRTADCSTLLAWDGVALDNVTIQVGRNVAPGRYSAGVTAINSAGFAQNYEMAVINVSSDGNGGITWNGGYNGNSFSFGNAINGATLYFVTVPPTVMAVTGDIPFHGGSVCDDRTNGDLQHGALQVTIGTAPTEPLRCLDRKEGGDQCKTCSRLGMPQYAAHSLLASLNIEDTPISYTPGRGPTIHFTVTYNQRETQQPQSFDYSNLGPKWTFNWLSFVKDDPNNPSADATVYAMRGGTEVYSGFDSGSQSYLPDPQSHASLVRTSAVSYERRFPDGSKQVFTLSDGSSAYPRKIFMTLWTDPAGNAVAIGYDSSFRIITLTDALGQVTTISYDLAGDPLKITKVTEPFQTGRYAAFTYNADGRLDTITDEMGIQSLFTYAPDSSNFITAIKTPYGTSNFATGESGTNRWIEMTDPLGGKERVEYRDNAPGIAGSDAVAPTGMTNFGLDVANTFYWDKKSTEMYPPVNGVYDYTKARITHWAYNSNGSASGIPASEKAPLENRTWYAYAGQANTNRAGSSASPTTIARILGDGSTQTSSFEYNGLGNRTKSIDPLGRVTSYIYDTNRIDLLEVRQTIGAANELLRKFIYNSQHQPLTDIDAAGQSTTYTYNLYGQILTRKNAKNETTTFTYGDGAPGHPIGYLVSITSPPFNNASAVTAFSYDTANRVRTVTDSDGYAVVTDYDNLDRPIQVTYPDGTTEQFQYSQDFGQGQTTILDLTKSKDRRGLWTTRHYNAIRQMDSITDPLNRTAQFGWCSCGSLSAITDPKNQTTIFNRDLQGRVYQKIFADNTSISYLYDGQTAQNTVGTSSRLKSVTNAKNQRTNYSYFADDNIQQITYTNTSGQPLNPPTPSVSFTYDSNYNRVRTMIDGIGTTTYAYNPIAVPPALGAGQSSSIDGPLLNDTISFGYDQLGRVTTRSINGATNSTSWVFDSLGRISSTTNKLGTFNYNYVNVTDRLASMSYPDGASTVYSYFTNAQDKRLQQIKNQTSANALISQFDYTYDTEGQILTWIKNYPGLSPAPQRFDLGYDNADQLTTAPLKNATTNALIRQYSYGYDFAANRTSELVGSTTTSSTPNNVNEIVSQSGGINRTLTYDLNGSLTNDGSSRTFEWDGANRLVAINYTGTTNRSEFNYDGLNRMLKIVEKGRNGRILSTRKFVWCGMEKCELRDANDTVTHFIFPQGQMTGTTPYFYTRDHLGSIREMRSTGKKGAIVARFDYDPYGRSTAVISNTLPDFNFTGLYRHATSNLDLAVYRAYDPDLGRWLNRDPIGERGGTNSYTYTNNKLANAIDPNGLDAIVLFASRAVPVFGRPQGHIATLIGSNQTGWYYYSRNGYDKWPWFFGAGNFSKDYFRTFEDFKNSDYAAQYDQAYHIKTGLDRDVAMIEYGEEHYNERYHSIIPDSNNCADLTEETLDAGGIPTPGDNQYPLYSPFGYLDPFNFGYIGSPEVPKFLFRNIIRTGAGNLWQVPP